MIREIVRELDEWIKPQIRKPLIITGVRGCGKKHALVNFGKNQFSKTYHINFEQMAEFREVFSGKFDPNRILDEIELYFGCEISLENDLIVLSEIQRCPGIAQALLAFGRLRSKLAISAICNNLDVGSFEFFRAHKEFAILRMTPFSFREFIAALGDKKGMRIYQSMMEEKRAIEWSHSYLLQLFRRYLVVGGMPEAIICYKETGSYSDVRKKQLEIIDKIFADLSSVSGDANGTHMKNIITSLINQMSEAGTRRVAKFSFKGVLPGSSARLSRIQKPLLWLQRQGIIHAVNIANDPSVRNELSKSFKLYLFDVGILSCLLNIDAVTLLERESFKGYAHLLENHVATALLAEKENLICWRGTNAEITFVRSFDNTYIPNDVRDQQNQKAKNTKTYNDLYSPDFTILTTDQPLNIDKKKREVNLPYYLAEFEW